MHYSLPPSIVPLINDKKVAEEKGLLLPTQQILSDIKNSFYCN